MTAWPKVVPGDDGIRPAGKPDKCLYCSQPIGSEHARDCVTIYKLVELQVLTKDGQVFYFTHEVPYHWETKDIWLHVNESSWCKNNLFFDESEAATALLAALGTDVDDCVCELIDIAVGPIVDPGPLVKLGVII